MHNKELISLSSIWNESIVRTEREPKERDYLWASQILKPPVDIWLQMRGTPPTNQPNERSKRKFTAGLVFEHLVSMVMMRSGVMMEKQDEVWTEYAMKVKGKGDFVLTGYFDFEKAIADIRNMCLPSSMEEMFLKICDKMREKFDGVEIEPTVFEIKSVAERTMSKIEKMGKPLESHILQTCHYKIGRGLKDGVVAVLCRDDLRLFEYHVTGDDEKRYVDRVNYLAGVVAQAEQPALAEKIIFDEVLSKFSKNLDVEYSSYLTLLYGSERPDMFSDEMKPIVARWNRVLPRIRAVQEGKRGKPTKKEPEGKLTVLTEKNLAAIQEMKEHGFDAYELAKIADISNEEEDSE